mmetsp:Transcript_60719/g.195626  ORF Transcript_60719/g.195626 Transcript_60719/m.195626 type:complete len:259 (-) Transcript_60719:63-839(-)
MTSSAALTWRRSRTSRASAREASRASRARCGAPRLRCTPATTCQAVISPRGSPMAWEMPTASVATCRATSSSCRAASSRYAASFSAAASARPSPTLCASATERWAKSMASTGACFDWCALDMTSSMAASSEALPRRLKIVSASLAACSARLAQALPPTFRLRLAMVRNANAAPGLSCNSLKIFNAPLATLSASLCRSMAACTSARAMLALASACLSPAARNSSNTPSTSSSAASKDSEATRTLTMSRRTSACSAAWRS